MGVSVRIVLHPVLVEYDHEDTDGEGQKSGEVAEEVEPVRRDLDCRVRQLLDVHHLVDQLGDRTQQTDDLLLGTRAVDLHHERLTTVLGQVPADRLYGEVHTLKGVGV